MALELFNPILTTCLIFGSLYLSRLFKENITEQYTHARNDTKNTT